MKIDNRVEFGICIKSLREKKGITQEKLAEMVGLKQPHIARIEAGKHSFGIDQYFSIIKELGVFLEIKGGI
jgi:transcriptional regulator with XRE-family HTH domain